jgi:hypothetical protein
MNLNNKVENFDLNRYPKNIEQFVPPASQIFGLVVEALKQHDPKTFSASVHLYHISFNEPAHFETAYPTVNIEFTPSATSGGMCSKFNTHCK